MSPLCNEQLAGMSGGKGVLQGLAKKGNFTGRDHSFFTSTNIQSLVVDKSDIYKIFIIFHIVSVIYE